MCSFGNVQHKKMPLSLGGVSRCISIATRQTMAQVTNIEGHMPNDDKDKERDIFQQGSVDLLINDDTN